VGRALPILQVNPHQLRQLASRAVSVAIVKGDDVPLAGAMIHSHESPRLTNYLIAQVADVAQDGTGY